MPLLLIVALLPLVEIALFIVIGARLGVGMTLLWVLGSAALGVMVLRGHQSEAQAMMRAGLRVDPGRFLARGAFRVLASLLLILPGFLTDGVGLILMVPAVQRMVLRGVLARATVVHSAQWQRDDIVEGDYAVQDPDPPAPQRRLHPPRDH